MKRNEFPKITSLVQLYELLPAHERLMVDVLRGIFLGHLPDRCTEALPWNVPCFKGHRNLALIWPASVPGGGVKSGVLLGFWHGNQLHDPDHYLTHGSNKQIFYRIYQNADEISPRPILKLLKEALKVDEQYAHFPSPLRTKKTKK